MNEATKTAFKPMRPRIVPRLLKSVASPAAVTEPDPDVKPAKPTPPNAPVTKPEPAPETPKVDVAPAKVSIFLQVISAPEKLGLGQAYLADTRKSGTGRIIGLTLFQERALIAQALEKQDEAIIRFVASVLLIELLTYSKTGRHPEVNAIGKALKQRLGVDSWGFGPNLTCLAIQLAQHEMTALDKLGLFEPPAPNMGIPWITLEDVQLPVESTVWQWNAKLERPERKPKTVTPERAPAVKDKSKKLGELFNSSARRRNGD
jgi:hypothetical protein